MGRRKTCPGHALLEDPQVRRWYEDLGQAALSTANVRLGRLGNFCEAAKKSPKALLALSEAARLAVLQDFIQAEQRRGMAGSYIRSTRTAVASYFAFAGKKLSRLPKIRDAYGRPTLENEILPSQEELSRIFRAATLRDRAAAALVAHSGLRLETLGNYRGTDGLRLRDFPELLIEGKKVTGPTSGTTVSFEKTPTLVVVRPGLDNEGGRLSKAGHRYITFLSEEGCRYLAEYLESRLRESAAQTPSGKTFSVPGEVMSPDTDVIHPNGQGRALVRDDKGEIVRAPGGLAAVKMFVTTINAGDGIRNAIRGSGFQFRPYALREYWETQMATAENRGKIAHRFVLYMGGHTGDISARYSTNRAHLPPSLVEELRGAYQRSEPFLSTIPTKNDTAQAVNSTRILLLGLKYTEEELAKVDLENLTTAQLQELVAKKLTQPPVTTSPPTAPNPMKKHRVVHPTEVSKYLDQGWVPLMKLSETEIVLSPPAA
ncbi:MAG: hypothetical protein KGJ23_06565 [Euryarchaeota archaeon]|nr:hypothetical protein [Euryarchaeota archaeon]MDE1836263.1 hypothetical protein [Euryarchaeota archaeon]MDE2044341.1 hypothetical protein [Thermoplasmata archaeon]